MEFRTESKLVDFFKNNLIDSFGIDNSKVLEEVRLGFGIADIVISEPKGAQTLSETQPLLNSRDITIYRVMANGKKTSLFEIEAITKIRKSLIKESLNKLLERKLIRCFDLEQDLYILDKKYSLSFSKSIAIEAKLRDWKRALFQAYRYKWFANYSYVMLDEVHIEPALKNLELFKKHNIGLISISLEGKLNKYNLPKKEKPYDPNMEMLLSETLLEQ